MSVVGPKSWGVCPECGVRVRVSLKWGQAYSHRLGWDVEGVCPGSGALVASPEDVEGVELVEHPRAPQEVIETPRYDFGASVSVRAVSGGLPGLGKHHS